MIQTPATPIMEYKKNCIVRNRLGGIFSLSKIKKMTSFLLKKKETLIAALRNYEKL